MEQAGEVALDRVDALGLGEGARGDGTRQRVIPHAAQHLGALGTRGAEQAAMGQRRDGRPDLPQSQPSHGLVQVRDRGQPGERGGVRHLEHRGGDRGIVQHQA